MGAMFFVQKYGSGALDALSQKGSPKLPSTLLEKMFRQLLLPSQAAKQLILCSSPHIFSPLPQEFHWITLHVHQLSQYRTGMMAVPSDLPLILAAMQASMSSATSKEQRTQAEALLAQLKESQICMELMLHILSVESEAHNDFIRLLSLTILSDWVKMWWNKINESDQTIVKNSVLTLLHGAIGRSPMRGLRTKLAVMISNIAVRSFPQLWSSFLEDMAGIVLSAGTSNTIEQKEIAFMAIEFTSADAIDSDYCAAIPIERRQDILGGYRTKLPQLLAFSCQFLMQCSNEFVTGMQETAAVRSGLGGGGSGGGLYGGQVHGKVLASLITCILRMVQSLAMFAKPEDICDATSNRDFSMIAVQFLSITAAAGSGSDYTELVWELQVEAVNLLHTITAQKLPADIFARLIEAIPRHVPQAATTYTGGNNGFRSYYNNSPDHTTTTNLTESTSIHNIH